MISAMPIHRYCPSWIERVDFITQEFGWQSADCFWERFPHGFCLIIPDPYAICPSSRTTHKTRFTQTSCYIQLSDRSFTETILYDLWHGLKKWDLGPSADTPCVLCGQATGNPFLPHACLFELIINAICSVADVDTPSQWMYIHSLFLNIRALSTSPSWRRTFHLCTGTTAGSGFHASQTSCR